MNAPEPSDMEAQARLLELINAGWTTQAVAAACGRVTFMAAGLPWTLKEPQR